MYEALNSYIQDSELRIVSDRIRVRMSRDIAKKYDNGDYIDKLAVHKSCIDEILSLQIKFPENKEPVFYIYIVPDDNFVKLLEYPYEDQTGGGCPVQCFDSDGFNMAYGVSQNFMCYNNRKHIVNYVSLLHEYSHLVENQFSMYKSLVFTEGFAELLPWYILDYEQKCPEHIAAVLAVDIYSAEDLLTINACFRDRIKGKQPCFQRSYISAYLFMRALIENIQKNLNMTKKQATQQYLDWFKSINMDKYWLLQELAQRAKMDCNLLLNTTEYQKQVLQKMQNTLTMNSIISTKDKF